jgi:hypothetical protein
MKILTICPSIYPKKLVHMMDSFLTTRSESTNIRVYYHVDTITNIFNKAFQDNPDYDFYFMVNDDAIFKTQDWDLKLAKKGKITYGNDLFQGENLCTFPMIDGDIVRALGWLQMPKLERYAGDVVWKFIGESLEILEYVPDVIIEHKWEGCTHPDINQEDMKRFAEWLPFSFKDVVKIREALCPKNTIR